MEPLYKIGEVVIRQAPTGNFPEGNGEYIIEAIIDQEGYRPLRIECRCGGRE